MTAYNMQDYIGAAIESVLNQTHSDLELIVVEDCSTDNTKEIIKGYMEKDDRVILIEHPENMGAGMGRRSGINEATGEYFITIDADDWIDPGFLKSLADRAEETGADIVSGGITVERGDGYWEKTCYGDLTTTGYDKVTKFWGEKVVFMNNKIIRTDFRNEVPYCHRRFIEDTPTIIPMLWLANQVEYVSDTGYHYRMQNNSLTHTSTAFKYALYRALCCLDLMDYFENRDPEILNKVNIKRMLQIQLSIIKKENPTDETIMQYMSDWIELTKRLIL